MSLPFRPERDAVPPTSIAGYPNGQIPANALELCGIRTFVMAPPAARAMRALVKAAERDGVRISTTGTYRSYQRQVVAFDGTDPKFWSAGIDGRYVPENLWASYESTGRKWSVSKSGSNDIRNWNGKRWKRRAGTAGSAVPGTSNHGRGIAIDFAEVSPEGRTVSLSVRTLNWLAANAPKFGYWNTVTSENWHWSWCLKDQVPPAVLAEEAGEPAPAPAPAPAPTPAPDLSGLAEVAKAIEAAKTYTLKKGSGGPSAPKGEQDAVFWLQNFLVAKGYKVTVDSWFWDQTDSAVRDFQSKNIAVCRVVDGVVGPVTWRALTA